MAFDGPPHLMDLVLGMTKAAPDNSIRQRLTREVREPQCATCRELRDELVNARAIALQFFEKYQALKAKQ